MQVTELLNVLPSSSWRFHWPVLVHGVTILIPQSTAVSRIQALRVLYGDERSPNEWQPLQVREDPFPKAYGVKVIS